MLAEQLTNPLFYAPIEGAPVQETSYEDVFEDAELNEEPAKTGFEAHLLSVITAHVDALRVERLQNALEDQSREHEWEDLWESEAQYLFDRDTALISYQERTQEERMDVGENRYSAEAFEPTPALYDELGFEVNEETGELVGHADRELAAKHFPEAIEIWERGLGVREDQTISYEVHLASTESGEYAVSAVYFTIHSRVETEDESVPTFEMGYRVVDGALFYKGANDAEWVADTNGESDFALRALDALSGEYVAPRIYVNEYIGQQYLIRNEFEVSTVNGVPTLTVISRPLSPDEFENLRAEYLETGQCSIDILGLTDGSDMAADVFTPELREPEVVADYGDDDLPEKPAVQPVIMEEVRAVIAESAPEEVKQIEVFESITFVESEPTTPLYTMSFERDFSSDAQTVEGLSEVEPYWTVSFLEVPESEKVDRVLDPIIEERAFTEVIKISSQESVVEKPASLPQAEMVFEVPSNSGEEIVITLENVFVAPEVQQEEQTVEEVVILEVQKQEIPKQARAIDLKKPLVTSALPLPETQLKVVVPTVPRVFIEPHTEPIITSDSVIEQPIIHLDIATELDIPKPVPHLEEIQPVPTDVLTIAQEVVHDEKETVLSETVAEHEVTEKSEVQTVSAEKQNTEVFYTETSQRPAVVEGQNQITYTERRIEKQTENQVKAVRENTVRRAPAGGGAARTAQPASQLVQPSPASQQKRRNQARFEKPATQQLQAAVIQESRNGVTGLEQLSTNKRKQALRMVRELSREESYSGAFSIIQENGIDYLGFGNRRLVIAGANIFTNTTKPNVAHTR